MRPKLVFCGPTLGPGDRPQEVGLVFLPPALQGSFLDAVRHYDPQAILLIDGGFQSQPAVRHKEILWTIGRGIPVLGAASMGALRAAELSPHMQGYGLIYRWYRRFQLTPDDAVAVLHGPAELNFSPVTVSLVDLRRSFRAALRRGEIPYSTYRALQETAQRLNFRDRNLARIISEALPDASAEILWAVGNLAICQQKRQDALAALSALRSGQYAQPSMPLEMPMTRVFAAELESASRPRTPLL